MLILTYELITVDSHWTT